jgi:hypothetical protein
MSIICCKRRGGNLVVKNGFAGLLYAMRKGAFNF